MIAADWNNIDAAAEWLMNKGDDASLVKMSFYMAGLPLDRQPPEGRRPLPGTRSAQARMIWRRCCPRPISVLRGGIQYEMGLYEDSSGSDLIGRHRPLPSPTAYHRLS